MTDARTLTIMSSMVIAVCGTRPEILKTAPVIKELYSLGVDAELWTVSQHKELLRQALNDASIYPSTEFSFDRVTPDLSDLMVYLGKYLAPALKSRKPNFVISQGDTTTAAITALSAFNAGLKVIHVEAGIRSHDQFEPFPEEANRRIIDHISKLKFAPTIRCQTNLVLEGLNSDVFVTGNTAIDSLKRILARIYSQPDQKTLLWPDGIEQRVMIDLHRREKWSSIPDIFKKVYELAKRRPDFSFLVPCHPNEIIRKPAEEYFTKLPNTALSGPLPHEDFIRHVRTATLVVTDSGGVQEEAAYLGIPVLVARAALDRWESIFTGQAEQIAPHPEAIPWRVEGLLDDPEKLNGMRKRSFVYGDGTAAKQIAEKIKEYLEKGR